MMKTKKPLTNKQKQIRFVAIILVIILAVMAIPYAHEFFSTRSTDGEPVQITISEGSSTRDIAALLKENDLIKSKLTFYLKLKTSGYGGKLQYGTFELNTGMSLVDLIETIATDGAKRETVTLTVPEGFSAEMIAARAEELGLFEAADFLAALKEDYDYGFLKELPKNKDVRYRLQGFLFPDTYEFYSDATPREVIDTMLRAFSEQYEALSASSHGMSLYDTITLASLVERESRLDSERATIAGVMMNRLEIDMLLQIDASVVYAVTDGLYNVTTVYYRDLEVNSPYNTYKFTGLPEGPICNPGLESIEAALDPETHEYFYYHTDETKKDGSHIFTETFEEHTETM